VQDVYDVLVSTGLKRIELSAHELAARAGVRNEMAVQSSLYLLERAGHLERRNRGIVMLDSKPAAKLRVDISDVTRRAQLERHKLREMIEFCYTENCYRAHILDYFGDRHHSPQCGTCGNCAQRQSKMMAPDLSKPSLGFDRGSQLRGSSLDFVARALNEDETLRVRKILACATRMKGRFGKNILAGTLRGSAAKNIMQAHLNELSTYGLLREMRQDDVMLYVEALVAARCLEISRGEYPTVSVTELGGRVMREQERVELALPPVDELAPEQEEFEPPKTIFRTYTLYCQGLSLQEIAKQRNLVSNTVEGHLIDCIRAGLDVDISKFVSMNDCALIEKAIDQHGTDKLRSLRDSLPENMTYNMIRFVVADWQRRKRSESEIEGSNQPA
jgi:superfamily II DNA helicase RecQ